MKRVALRGREVEENMSRDYLEQLAHDYETFVESYRAAHPEVKILSFSGDELDFVHNPDDLTHVLKTIERELELTKGAQLK
jgi:deoxyguanosine kinase